MGEPLLTRARRLVAAGPFDARASEIAAVHAAIYPKRDAVCETCPRELGPAFFAIKRWAEQQGAASDAPTSFPPMKKNVTARFKSDSTIYTPHGLGVAYSNANLTDKAARDIIAADPDAAGLFDVLPPAADKSEGTSSAAAGSDASSNSDTTPAPTTSTSATLPANFSYKKLAKHIVNELERRQTTHEAVPATQERTDEVTLTAQAGGQGADGVTTATSPPATVAVTTGNVVPEGADEHQDDKPVRLSRMGKDQLRAAHLVEVGTEAHADATNDDLREAIAAKRASLATE